MVENTEKILSLSNHSSDFLSYSSSSMLRSVVLNYLFRFESLTDKNDQIIDVNSFLINKVVRNTIASETDAVRLLEWFFNQFLLFRKKLSSISRANIHKREELYNITHKYLVRTHRIAPVFDLRRAEKNLRTLHTLFSKILFWPKISIQLSLVIFVTDRNDVHWREVGYILQKNLRTFLTTSAYAFHRSRNKLGINREGQLDFSKLRENYC